MTVLSGMNWLRAIAALLVVLYHLNQHLPLGGLSPLGIDIHRMFGHLSIMVSVFFMLSGFFRSLSYWKVIQSPENIPSLWPSLKERYMRIAPAYYIMLIVSLLVTYLLYGTTGLNIGAFLSGFVFLSWISPDTIFPVLLNGPLWFISIDMIGWIMTSLFMMGICRIWKLYYIPYFLIIAMIMLGLHSLWIHLPWPEAHGVSAIWFPVYNPFLFFLHFLFGIGAAGIVTWLKWRGQVSNMWFDIGCSITVLASILSIWIVRYQDDWISYPHWPYHFPWMTSMIAIIMICLPFTKYIGRYVDNSFFIFTAKISYSLFLTHALIIAILWKYLFPEPLTLTLWMMYSGVTLIISYITAWILYRYIEVPCIPKKKVKPIQ